MDYISICKWEEYQHYSHRNPPWIKLHNKILDNYDYGCLQDASKLLLISLFMLASKTENHIPMDLEWIKSKATLKGKIDLEPLIKYSFINIVAESKQDASTMLATCKQNGGTEKSRVEKSRVYIDTIRLGSFQNIKLTKEELTKLKDKFGEQEANRRIEVLSEYMASKGKKYASHYATILAWARKEGWSDGNKGNGGRHDNVFLRALRETKEGRNSGRMDGGSEAVSGRGDSLGRTQGHGGVPEDADPAGRDPEDADKPDGAK